LIIKKASPLTSSLLARKGTAGPSFLTQVHPPIDGLPSAVAHQRPYAAANRNDEPDQDGGCGPCTPDADAVHTNVARDHHGRIKLSFRLDQDRHLRLKLAAAHTDRHIQDILTAALDRYLTDLAPAVKSGGCTCYPKVSHPTDD
jgi:hypothetical protein